MKSFCREALLEIETSRFFEVTVLLALLDNSQECGSGKMDAQQVEIVYRSLFLQGGVTNGLDFEREGFCEMWLTERGNIATQCSQQNDLRTRTTNCGLTLRPHVYPTLVADQETERINIGVQTLRNAPTQDNDHRPEC